jgi:hypothetical protein
LISLVVGLLPNGADLIGFSKVPLVGCYVFDTAVAMLAVVPLHKASNPAPHGIQAAKAAQGVALMILTAPRDCVYIVLNSASA